MITPADDFFHERTDDPFWNESSWFGFGVPERDLGGALYLHHRPNRGYVWAGCMLWDSATKEIHDCLWHDWAPQPLAPEVQLPHKKVFDFSTPNGFRVRNPEPLKRYEFEYQNGPCEVELVWEGFMEPFDTGLAESYTTWCAGHYEQAGRATGRVKIAGESYDVDCIAVRDRSWGSWDASGLARGGFELGFASEDHGFVVQSASAAQNLDEDPVVGTTEPVRTGFYIRDGEIARLVSGTRVVERDPQNGHPTVAIIDAVDEKGRELRAVGRTINVLNWAMFGSQIFWYWSVTEWEIDGKSGCWGEVQDFFPGSLHRRFARSLRPARVPVG